MVMQYKVGLQNVGSYQVSGVPYTEAGIDPSANGSVTFPRVTTWVYIINNHANLVARVGFSANGVAGSNYVTVPASGTLGPLHLKVSALHFGGGSDDVDIVAGLTTISSDLINNPNVSIASPHLNWSGSSGVG